MTINFNGSTLNILALVATLTVERSVSPLVCLFDGESNTGGSSGGSGGTAHIAGFYLIMGETKYLSMGENGDCCACKYIKGLAIASYLQVSTLAGFTLFFLDRVIDV